MTKLHLSLFIAILLLSACAPTAPVLDAAAIDTNASPFGELAQADLGLISPSELAPHLASSAFTLVDVRTSEELADTGIIEGAIHIPLDQLAASLDRFLAKDALIVVYCRSGNRSNTAQGILEAEGYSNVLDLDGGIRAWAAAGYAFEPFQP